MASLEQSQGLHNQIIANQGNVSESLDPNQTLIAGAAALGTGEALGHSKEETLAALSRTRRRQKPARLNNRETAEAFQRFASITNADGSVMPQELESGTRSLTPNELQMAQDGGERDQSPQDRYDGRDTNRFSRWNDNTKSYEEVIVPDGQPTPDEFRDDATLADMGLRKVKTGQEEVLDRRGAAVVNQQGEVIMRNTYDIESNINDTGAGQGWTGGGGQAAAGAVERLEGSRTGSQFTDAELQERLFRMYGENIPTEVSEALDSRLRRTADPAQDKAAESAVGRETTRRDGERFSAQGRLDVQEAERNMVEAKILAGMNLTTGDTDNIEYIPGALTKSNVDPERGVATRALRAESDARFNARPQAVIANEDAVEIANSLGSDVSAYVDLGTGEGVQGVTPSRLTTNMPNTSQQLNAPVTSAASWVASNTQSSKGLLTDTNMSQITADFSRRVEAAAPGYRSRPVSDVEGFASQLQRVMEAKAAKRGKGGNFYEPVVDENGQKVFDRNGRQRQRVVENPGTADVLRELRMSGPEQQQLANALFTMQTAEGPARPVSSVSPGVSVNMGSMFGENIDLGRVRSDTQRAAFATANDEDAQRNIIGSIRERDEFGKVTAEEPKPTRQVMKGRSPDEAVATYVSQRKQNKQPVDPVRVESIRRENESLRADTRMMDDDAATRRLITQSGTGKLPARQAEDDAFFSTPNNKDSGAVRAPVRRDGALVSLRQSGGSSAPASQPYDSNTDYDVASRFEDRRTQSRGPAPVATPAVEPNINTNDAVSKALKTEIAARASQGRQQRMRRVGGGAAAAGGVAALVAALTGNREEEEVYS